MADNYMTFNDAVEVLTPYAEKINTIKPESITWAAYQLLTSEQRAAKRYLITDYPSPTGYVNKLSDLEDVSINSQTLSNGQIPVYNSTTEVWENKTILENSLTSTATDVALTAAQGKVLQDTKQAKNLATPLTINDTQETTVEGALGGLNDYGDALADNLAANENVYGAKQMLPYPFYDTTKTDSGITFTDNGNGTLTINGTASADAVFVLYVAGSDYASRFAGKTILANMSGGNAKTYFMGQADNQNFFYTNDEAQATFPLSYNSYLGVYIIVENGAVITTPITISFMIRDARVIDPTFAPFAKTNLQLTNDKAERTDLAMLNLTGSTNSTGLTINAGTFFYLNGIYCKAKTNIANGATFTENTNYEPTNIGKELSDQTITAITGSSASYTIRQNAQYNQSYYMKRGGFVYVNILVDVVASESSWTAITNNLPQMSGFTTINPPFMGSDNTTDHVAILLQNGVLYAMGGTVGKVYAVCFCYPA